VPPRGFFSAAYADTRQDLGAGTYLLSATSSIAAIPASVGPITTITNTYNYPVSVFGIWTASITRLSIASDAVYKFTTTVYSDTTVLVSSNRHEYGSGSGVATGSSLRQMQNINYRNLLLGAAPNYPTLTLAPGASLNLTIRTTWVKESGSTNTNNFFTGFASALRVFLGTN
jgi:hypothetical protein